MAGSCGWNTSSRRATSPPAKLRVLLAYEIPMAEILVDFYDNLKGSTSGYASLDYQPAGYRAASLVKVDVLVNGQVVDALSIITHRENASREGRSLVLKLRSLIPRQMFDVPLQAAIGGRIIARETVRAHAQERPRQVLRWRHNAKAEAARTAGRGQEAHEARRQRGDSAGSLHGRPAAT